MIGTSVRCYGRVNEPLSHINGDGFVDQMVTNSISAIRLNHAVNFVHACTKFVTEFC
jgi:hypothetical protein